MSPRDVLDRIDLPAAVAAELQVRNRLLPRRWDHTALAQNPDDVAARMRPALRRRRPGPARADVLLADKGWRGTRPLDVLALQDRVLYRAVVDLIKMSLPEHLSSRPPMAEFRRAPLGAEGATHISKTDVTAYYQYIDHELLADELIAQTGEEPAVDALMGLLRALMGRGMGIPQIHPVSDVLGDTYLDPVRRSLLREGLAVWRYADDFRIASASLGEARRALETCAAAVRERGLVLNERKTLTYVRATYEDSLDRFRRAEQELFSSSGGDDDDGDDLALLDDSYADPADDAEDDTPDAHAAPTTLGAAPLDAAVDDDEANAVHDDAEDPEAPSSALDTALAVRRTEAARRAWYLWIEEEEDDEQQQSTESAAITQSLVGRALPALGAAGDNGPLKNVSQLLRYEPAITPQIAAYLTRYAATSATANHAAARALGSVARSDLVSPWQTLWLAHTAGRLRPAPGDDLAQWLTELVHDGRDALAATAGAALGRRGEGDPAALARRLEHIAREWRSLLLYGLGLLAPALAVDTSDSDLDRLLLAALPR